MIETPRAFEWLYQTLSADPILSGYVDSRIYRNLAPQKAEMPYVILQYQGGHDVRGVGPGRVMAQIIYVVKVVGPAAQYTALKAIADRVDGILHGASGQVADGEILGCVRETSLDYEEMQAGVRYQHLGGQYRLYVQQKI